MRKGLIEIPCDNCGRPFKRHQYTVTNNKNRGRKNVCSQTCKIQIMRAGLTEESYANRISENYSHPSYKADKYTPFRYMFSRSRLERNIRGERLQGNLTIEDVKKQWDKQKGKCAYTELSMTLKKDSKNKLLQASLDRIDSAKPYQKGNIEIVCMGVNYMKNKFPKEMATEFIQMIRDSAVCKG